MSIISKLKNNEIRLPVWFGQLLSYIPYSCRPMVGAGYRVKRKEISDYEKMSEEEKREYIFKNVYAIVKYALENIPFYQQFYASHAFSLEDLKSYEDIQKIPVLRKADLLSFPIEQRTNMNVPKFLANTGGSSGHTLSFYVQPSSFGNEWAHIHRMWSFLGFRPSDLKLYIAGRTKVRDGVDYEFARHTLSVDMYRPYSETAPRLVKMLKKHPCFYLHGYPSVLAEFANYCKSDAELLGLLKGRLRGAFLSSEYPYPKYRDVIEDTFGIKSQSFYGHTERCVMAYETEEKFHYCPFQTYGYTEAVKSENGDYHLVGTCYGNMASPLIRYDTEDVISNPVYEDGILKFFDIKEGRSGQFIADADGRMISLTGLIMGRHHKLFDYCEHIQVHQDKLGFATVYYVLKPGAEISEPENMFDSENIGIQFSFEQKDKPVRTVSGKVNLLV